MKTLPRKMVIYSCCILNFFCLSCGSKDEVITVYPLVKLLTPESGLSWVNSATIKFKVYPDHVVVSWKDRGMWKETNCTILTKDDWACRDYSGRFGISDGVFFRDPKREEYKYASMWEWNYIRCQWLFVKKDFFSATYGCFADWK